MRGERSKKVRSTPIPCEAVRRTVKLAWFPPLRMRMTVPAELLNAVALAFLDADVNVDRVAGVDGRQVGSCLGFEGFQVSQTC